MADDHDNLPQEIGAGRPISPDDGDEDEDVATVGAGSGPDPIASAQHDAAIGERFPSTTYDLFLSYHTPDRDAVRTVQHLLEARGIRTFLDRDRLAPGLPWPQALESALRNVRAVAVFLSREELGNWQKREVWFALDRQAREEQGKGTFPVIPVLLPDADPTSGFLFLNTWVDLRRDLTDPEALDDLVCAVQGGIATQADGRVGLCPYRGLQVFHEEHAGFFFGREAFAEQLREAVQRTSLVAVVGPSGSGKSSVVQAGLLPLLHRQRPPAQTWDSVLFTPNNRPFHSLAAGLIPLLEPTLSETDRLAEAQNLGNHLADGTVHLGAVVHRLLVKSAGTDRLLLVADQFEELFTLTPEPLRQPFVAALLEIVDQVPMTLVLTLRADFYGHAIVLDRELSDRLGAGVVNLGPMRRQELNQAVVEPAQRVGLRFEPGLVETILDDVAEQPGSLPLLEHALLELWERRRDGRLTLEGYQASGGVMGAIAQRAETLYGRFLPAEQMIARRVLLRLTQPGQGTEDTRRRAALDELVTRTEERAGVEQVVRTLTDARLLTTDWSADENDADRADAQLDIAHEALIRGWPRLRNWLDEDRAALRVHRRLTDAALEWNRDGDEGHLYRGLRLAQAVEWRDQHAADLNETERAFLDASVQREQGDRVAREGERWRTILGVVIGSAIAVVILLLSSAQYRTTSLSQEATDAVNHTFEVIGFTNQFLGDLNAMESAYYSYLLVGDDAFLEAYFVGSATIDEQFAVLRELSTDNPQQVARWVSIYRQADDWRQQVTEPGVALRREVSGGRASMSDLITYVAAGESRRRFAMIRRTFNEALDIEERLLTLRQEEATQRRTLTGVVLAVGTIVGTVLSVLLVVLLRSNFVPAWSRSRRRRNEPGKTDVRNLL